MMIWKKTIKEFLSMVIPSKEISEKQMEEARKPALKGFTCS
jgi:hypothetical protein